MHCSFAPVFHFAISGFRFVEVVDAVPDAGAANCAADDDVDNGVVVGSQFSVKMLLPFCSSDGEMRMGLWLDITTFF